MKLICIKSFKINQSKSHNFDFSIYLKAKKGIEFSISTELEHYQGKRGWRGDDFMILIARLV
jgi:hypothetical protein